MKKTLSLLVIFLMIIFIYASIISYFARHEIITDSKLMHISVRLAGAGKNPYLKDDEAKALWPCSHSPYIHNLSPPSAILMATPFMLHLDYRHSYALVLTICCFANLLAIGLLARRFFQQNWWQAFLAIAIMDYAFMFSIYNLTFGDIALGLNALLIFSFLALEKKQPMLSGLFLGIAVNLKLFFGLFFIFLLAKKNYAALCYFGLFASLIAAASFYLYGIETYLTYIGTLHHIDWYGFNWNASYYGFLSRLFYNPSEKITTIFHLPFMVTYPYYALLAAYCFIIVAVCKKLNNNLPLNISFIITCMLLLSPLGWAYYFPCLLLCFIVVFKEIQTEHHYLAYFFSMLMILFVMALPFNLQIGYHLNIIQQQTWGNILFIALLSFHLLILHLIYFSRKQRPTLISPRFLNLLFSTIFIIATGCGLIHLIEHYFGLTLPEETSVCQTHPS